MASIAYVDPGNVAANLTAGAEYGYLLVWVLVVSNAMAVLVQYLSAKLGLVTGRSLPELLAVRMGRRTRLSFWLQAEVVAAATDVAEVVGGAIALSLLFHLPLVWGGVITGAVSMVLLSVQSRRGQQPFEFVIMGLLAVIAFGFLAGLFVSPVDWVGAAGGLLPQFDGSGTVRARGIDARRHSDATCHLPAFVLGARPSLALLCAWTICDRTTMSPSRRLQPRRTPHAHLARLPRLLRATKIDVMWSLVIAGSVNIAMLLLAARSLRGVAGTDTIAGAHHAIVGALGPAIGVIFAVGLLASGLASTSVGAYAGAVVMGGLIKKRIPLLVRRLVTLVPALVVLSIGTNPTQALVISQVVLSLGIPFALIPLVRLTSSRDVMGQHVTALVLRSVSWVVVGLILALNVALLGITFAGAW